MGAHCALGGHVSIKKINFFFKSAKRRKIISGALTDYCYYYSCINALINAALLSHLNLFHFNFKRRNRKDANVEQ
jgi:hypothetical protein